MMTIDATPQPAPFLLSLVLNGQAVTVACQPDTRLLTLLRETFGLTGAKPGCEIGRCGACMIWLDGAPANACLLMAYQLQGRAVRTIESVSADAGSAPVRDALARYGGVQCGYCTPGMVMTMTWLHAQRPLPTAEEAGEQLCGNLCRCTGYGGIRRAVDALFPAMPGGSGEREP